MLPLFDGIRSLGLGAVAVKTLMACLCGTLIGLERSSKNRPAGFRTHTLVCLAAALAALTSLYIFLEMKLPSDISRIGGQVISGLGFIGAGTIIITKRMTIKGLTTAAGLWTTGVIGLAIGSGYYELGLLGTALVLVAETWLARLGSTIQHTPEYGVEVLYNEKTSLDQVLRFCKDNRMSIVNLTIHTAENVPQAEYIARVRLRGNLRQDALVARIQQMPGIMTAMGL